MKNKWMWCITGTLFALCLAWGWKSATPSTSVVFSYYQSAHLEALMAASPKELEGVRFSRLHVREWLATVEGGTHESRERKLNLAMSHLDQQASQELDRLLNLIPMPQRDRGRLDRPFEELGRHEGLFGRSRVRWKFYNRIMSDKYSYWPRLGSGITR